MEYAIVGSMLAPMIGDVAGSILYDVIGESEKKIPGTDYSIKTSFVRPEIKAQREAFAQQQELLGQQTQKQREMLGAEYQIQTKMLEKQQELEKKKLEYMPEYLSKIAESEAKAFQTKAKAIGETFQDLRGKYGDVGARTLLGALSYGSGSEGWKSGLELAQQTPQQYQYQPITARPIQQVEVPAVQWRPSRSASDTGSSNLMNYLMFRQQQQQATEAGQEAIKTAGEVKNVMEQTLAGQKIRTKAVEKQLQEEGKKLEQAVENVRALEEKAKFQALPHEEKVDIIKKQYDKTDPRMRFDMIPQAKQSYEREGIIKSFVEDDKLTTLIDNDIRTGKYKRLLDEIKSPDKFANTIESYPHSVQKAINKVLQNTLEFGEKHKPGERGIGVFTMATTDPRTRQGILDKRDEYIELSKKIQKMPNYYDYFEKNVDEAIIYNLAKPDQGVKGNKGYYTKNNPLSKANIKNFLNPQPGAGKQEEPRQRQ